MKILTLCAQGNNRSVVLASILRNEYKYKDVISQGAFTSSQETLVMLYDWADLIFVVEESLIGLVHPEYKEKVVFFNLGEDVWGYKHNPSLQNKIRNMLKEAGI